MGQKSYEKMNLLITLNMTSKKNEMTLKEWVSQLAEENAGEDYTTFLEDVTQHGCVSGIIGELVYYRDTTKFYDKHEEEIWERLYNVSDNMGIPPLDVITRFRGASQVDTGTEFKNLLAWWATENVAGEILAERE